MLTFYAIKNAAVSVMYVPSKFQIVANLLNSASLFSEEEEEEEEEYV